MVFVYCAIVTQTYGANVLFLNAAASPSHHIYNRALVVGLADKGHNVTFVSVDVSEKTHQNVHYIHLEKTYDVLYGDDDESFEIMKLTEESSLSAIFAFHDFTKLNCDGVLASNGLDVILNYPNDFKFDIVIYDFTCGPCLLPLIHKFNYPPLVAITAFGNPPFTNSIIGSCIKVLKSPMR